MHGIHKSTSRYCLLRRAVAAAAGLTLATGITVSAQAASVVSGMDVSSHQGNVDWGAAWADGARFAYIKATEGTYYTNDYFAQQYNGSYNVGMIRGSYHFAIPDDSGGATQADYFIAHGGGWSPDGKTLPGALDIEYNPYGATCYGLSQSSMVFWIAAFSNEYHSQEGVYPVIYTTTDWWTTCTGNSAAFASTNPLWIARYASNAGTLPAGWGYDTFWQYADSGAFPGDQDQFNGAYDRLQALADG
jgi:GH25 family lysozyme M1 (1,4-beta-N-acetylmuramidase)